MLNSFMASTERLGLNTDKAQAAQMEYVKSLVLGRDTLSDHEKAVMALNIQFEQFERALVAVGWTASEAAKITGEGLAKALEDLEASMQEVEESIQGIIQERESLELRLYRAMGNTNAIREIEIQKLDESNRQLMRNIWALEDEQQILTERENLELRLYQLLEDTNKLRELEIETLDESNQQLMKNIWAIEDMMDVAREAEYLADTFEGVAQSLKETRMGLWTGADSPLGIADRMGLQGAMLQQLTQTALTGPFESSLEAMRMLPGAVGDYLGTARQFYADPLDYAREVAKASFALSTVEGAAKSEAELLREEVSALKDQLARLNLTTESVAEHTSDTAGILGRWQREGLPVGENGALEVT